jgi:C4-dicarboxylate-specific signal transduction histidine kinase
MESTSTNAKITLKVVEPESMHSAVTRLANAAERIANILEKLELFANDDEAALEVTDEKSYQ